MLDLLAFVGIEAGLVPVCDDEGGAVIKCVLTDRRDAAWNGDAGQRSTAVERMIADGCDAAGNSVGMRRVVFGIINQRILALVE